MRLWTRALALLAAASLLSTGLAAGEPRSYEGYCENGKPVITYWNPKLDELFESECSGSFLSLKLKAQPPVDEKPQKPIVFPDDFYTWAYVYINGRGVINPYEDVMPFVAKSTGRTLIPVRVVTEAMGGTAEWNREAWEVTIRLGEKHMKMAIGKTEAIVNGKPVILDQPPLLWLDRTMVPIRVVAEAFGAAVTWNQWASQVDIELGGIKCPDTHCVDI